MWNNAPIAPCPPPKKNCQPKNCGLFLENGMFKIKWFEGEMSPNTVKITCPENEDDVSSVITAMI